MKLLVVAHLKRKPEAAPVVKDCIPWLQAQGHEVQLDESDDSDLSATAADFVIVVGGDGTMLSVARRLKGNTVPVLGVNMGQLGFLAELPHTEFKQQLPGILAGKHVTSPRMMLRARFCHREQEPEREMIALNDAVLLRLPKAAMMSVGVTVSGEAVARYKGDGLIVSTATGSTGYGLSAGGPILSERLKAMILVPICPHTLANRPIVVSGDEVLTIEPETRSGSPVELVMDGQESISLRSGTCVTIEKAPYEVNIVSIGRKGRYEIIRDKLHWAGWVKETR